MTAQRLIAIALLLLPTSVPAETVTEGGFTFEVQTSDALYRAVRIGGDVDSRYDIAVLGDGFKEDEQGVFNAAVNEIVAEFFTIPPYDTRRCAFNFWVVNLVSNDSGIDEGTTQRDTPLDCKRAVPGEPISYVTGDFDKCRQVCDLAEVPAYDAIYVVVNSIEFSAWAYPSNAIAFTTRQPYAGWLLAHELAHLIAELDDEYTCRMCDGSDSGLIYYGPPITESPNLSTILDPYEVIWKDLVTYPDRPVPTDPDNACRCSDVGFWVGGGYYAYGIYRPEEYCLMDGVLCPENDAFCKVCVRAIKGELLWCPSFTVDTLGAVPVAQLHDMRDMERIIWQDDSGIARRIEYCSLCEPEDPHLTMIVI
ncbi:MAG: M64 family metallopeptidase, partial [Candidatus Krumholzibacteria bacterium]|nr:M64 family metallopeptidase [Candidatus Krumholzibacteria bacterium]